jgi:Tfp pilus assembly protein PilP
VWKAGAVTVFAVSGLLALSGCGGSSAPSKSQYVAKADAICSVAHNKTAPLIGQVIAAGASLASGNAKSARQLAPVVQRLHAAAAAALAQLQALRQPSGEHAAIERFLTPLASIVEAIGKATTAMSSGQAPQALGLLAQVQPVTQQATSAAQAYGVPQCGTVVSALG